MSALLPFIPEQGGYGVGHPVQVISVELDGGAPRLRADKQGAAGSISASWLLDRVEYTAFLKFVRVTIERGALPFRVDLVTEFHQLCRHLVTIVPGSLRTSMVAGLTYRISADLRVEQPIVYTGLFFFTSPNVLTTPSPVDLAALLKNPGTIQLIGAEVNNGVNTPVDLDGIFTVTSFPTAASIQLSSPAGVNPDWSLLASYPGGITGTIDNVSVVHSPS